MCAYISKILEAKTVLGKRSFYRLLQIDDGYSICEHPVTNTLKDADEIVDSSSFEQLGLTVLAVRISNRDISHEFHRLLSSMQEIL